MRCSKAQRWVSQRMDGVLDQRHVAPLESHLATCEVCRGYAEALGPLDLDLLTVPPEPTSDFTARFAERLAQMPARRPFLLGRPAVFRPIAAGLGIAAALGGFVVGSRILLVNRTDTAPRNGTVELAAGNAADPLAEDSVENVLIAALSSPER